MTLLPPPTQETEVVLPLVAKLHKANSAPGVKDHPPFSTKYIHRVDKTRNEKLKKKTYRCWKSDIKPDDLERYSEARPHIWEERLN